MEDALLFHLELATFMTKPEVFTAQDIRTSDLSNFSQVTLYK